MALGENQFVNKIEAKCSLSSLQEDDAGATEVQATGWAEIHSKILFQTRDKEKHI